MKITSVSYRKLVSGPGFTHQAVEMTASVDHPHETVEGVLNELRRLVHRELNDADPQSVEKMRATLREAVMKVESIMDATYTARDLPF